MQCETGAGNGNSLHSFRRVDSCMLFPMENGMGTVQGQGKGRWFVAFLSTLYTFVSTY